MNKKFMRCVLFSMITFDAYAQKLPNVQEGSQRAPNTIKVDGKASEWNNKFQAYNRATNIFYTIANDDDNLYLIIQVTDPVIISKIVSAGITFIVNKPDKKNNENVISVTYPIFDIKDKPNVYLKNVPKINPNDEASVLKADSFMSANNKRLINKSKWIKINGIKDIDTLMSVYNREGIKAAELFDNKMVYTFELSIALKLLGLSINDVEKFAYQIKSNSITRLNLDGYSITKNPPGSQTSSSLHVNPGAFPFTREDYDLLYSTTDFKGEYTLAKK